MGIWSKIKRRARNIVSKVRKRFQPEPEPRPTPEPTIAQPAQPVGPQSPVTRPAAQQELTLGQRMTANVEQRAIQAAQAQNIQAATSGVVSTDPSTGRQIQTTPQGDVRFTRPFEDEQPGFFTGEGQRLRAESAVVTPIQALGAQFGIGPGVDADSAVLKWLANNPLVVAGAGATAYTAAAGLFGTTGAGAAATGTAGAGPTIQMATNPATGSLINKAIGTVFSNKTTLFFGLYIAKELVDSLGMGFWGQAEAPESPAIQVSSLYLRDAMETGDFTLVDEAMLAAHNATDLNKWEQIGQWIPGGAEIIGSRKKLKANAAGVKILQKFVDYQRKQFKEGLTDDEKWAQIRAEEKQNQLDIIDYRNSERKKMFKWEQDAREQERTDVAEFWAKERAKQRELERLDREAIAKFWLEYRKLAQKIDDNDRPSKLGFGLL